MEEKYIGNKVTQDTYDKWFPVYSRELNTKSIEISELEKDSSEELNQYKEVLPALTSMESIYDLGGVDDKQSFLKGIFWVVLPKKG